MPLVAGSQVRFNLAMNPKLSVFVGLRYALSNRREGFLSFVSLFSLIAMALGVTILIVVLSVMNGFDREIKNRLLNVLPHATLTQSGGLQNWQIRREELLSDPGLEQVAQHIIRVAPYIDGEGLVAFEGRHQAVSLQGVRPEDMDEMLSKHMVAGAWNTLPEQRYGVILGQILAQHLGVVPGDKVLVTLPQLNVTPMGAFPRVKRMEVQGVFKVGGQVDSHVAFIHLRDAKVLFRSGDRVDGLRFWFADPYQMPGLEAISQTLESDLGKELSLSTWQQESSDLFGALKLEKTMVGLLLSIIICVAAFNIIAALVLMVNEKRSDIAVLRSYGASPFTIAGIFNVQGLTLGLLGILLGLILGCLLALKIGSIVTAFESLFGFNVFDPNLFFISYLPSHLIWQDVALVAGFALVLILLATIYPASRASQVNPAEALQNKH